MEIIAETRRRYLIQQEKVRSGNMHNNPPYFLVSPGNYFLPCAGIALSHAKQDAKIGLR
jgi:hypothetical protein